MISFNALKTKFKKAAKSCFVGTKKQIKDCIMEEAVRCNMPYVTETVARAECSQIFRRSGRVSPNLKK